MTSDCDMMIEFMRRAPQENPLPENRVLLHLR